MATIISAPRSEQATIHVDSVPIEPSTLQEHVNEYRGVIDGRKSFRHTMWLAFATTGVATITSITLFAERSRSDSILLGTAAACLALFAAATGVYSRVQMSRAADRLSELLPKLSRRYAEALAGQEAIPNDPILHRLHHLMQFCAEARAAQT